VPAELWVQAGSLLAKDPRSRPASAAAALDRLAPLQNRLDQMPALPPVPGRLPPVPGRLPPVPGQLPAVPGQLPPPGQLPAAPGQLLPPGQLPAAPGQLPAGPGQTLSGRGSGQTLSNPPIGSGPQTVLRARDRGQGPGPVTGPPSVVPGPGGHGRVRAQRRRAVLIAVPAALVLVAAAAFAVLLTRSPHTASPAADSRPAATRDASQPAPTHPATGSAASRTPTVPVSSQPADPAGGPAPSHTQQANPAAGPAPSSNPPTSPAGTSPSPSTTPTPVGEIDSPCGTNCVALYSLSYGDLEVLAVVGGQQDTGQPVDLLPSSNNGSENWIVRYEGTVSQFYSAGLMSAGMNQNYGSDGAYEYEYVPYGVISGLCLGVSGNPGNGTLVTLQPCNETAETLWVSDTAAQDGQQLPLIIGTNTDFTEPFVLTVSSTSSNATTRSLGGTENGQYWNTEYWG
jgi:hypothetical protein